MDREQKELRIIISGGGTGGHIFPAVSIANAIKAKRPDAKILFVGALGRMEMQRVPAAGYDIKGLPICGFDRKNMLRNVIVLYRIWKSQRMARKIIKEFRPMAAVGVGGYASGPTLNQCASMGIPCLIQEQNSYAGVTNKLLAKKAAKICVAYEGMERFFPKEKIIFTGNPVRKDLLNAANERAEGIAFYGLDANKKTVLITGGSLGAGSINKAMVRWLEKIAGWKNVQVIWQCGSYYHKELEEQLKGRMPENVKFMPFLKRMAYACADLVVARAGAGTISELCLLGKAAVLVPSPNVAEDHQTKNAMALVNKQAAVMVKDAEVVERLGEVMERLLQDDGERKSLSDHILTLAMKNSDEVIAREILKIM